MIENSQDELCQLENKQPKSGELHAIIRCELENEKYFKTFFKVFARQNLQS